MGNEMWNENIKLVCFAFYAQIIFEENPCVMAIVWDESIGQWSYYRLNAIAIENIIDPGIR